MTLAEYQTLTGTTVSAAQTAVVEAQILRTRRILENMLGFPINSKKLDENLYEELGKSPTDCPCSDIDSSTLLDADEVTYAYRLFSYNAKDKYLHIDPFTELYSVKLVKDGVTLKTLDADDYRAQYRQGWAKFIENCQSTLCYCDCDCVQLAVDAKWLDLCKLDLKYVWADMIGFYVDCKKDVKSESIGSHSYTKFDRPVPESEDYNLSILKKFAGPNGSLSKVITV